MDAENGELYFADVEEDGVTAGDNWNLDSVDTKFVCSDVIFTNSEKQLAEWEVDPHCGLNDSESEDVLHAINPNEVFASGSLGETLSESDSGISEDPVEGPVATVEQAHQAHATIYQVVYDVSSLGHVKAEQNMDVISIQLDDWNSQMLISESCIVNELPIVSANQLDNRYAVTPVSSTAPSSPESSLLFPDLRLTEEEQKLLNQEGISLPNNLPLTKAEERILKKVRRKIRNKQSAQDSRRRRKDYIDGLESRAAACSAQNKELQRTVEQLEKHNMSLLAQLRRLQSLIKQTVTKAAQTSTCILIILFSLGLIIIPSYSPFSRVSSLEDDYKPKGVISRNILTDPTSFQQVTDEADSPAIQTDSLPVPPDLNQSGPLVSADVLKQPVENTEIRDLEGVVQEESQLGNSSTLAGEQTDSLALDVTPMAGKGGLDPAKPAHADEM